jgi:hypothetical protein
MPKTTSSLLFVVMFALVGCDDPPSRHRSSSDWQNEGGSYGQGENIVQIIALASGGVLGILLGALLARRRSNRPNGRRQHVS